MFLFFSNTLQITIVKYYFQRQHSLSAFLLVLQSRLWLASWPAAADHVTSRDRDNLLIAFDNFERKLLPVANPFDTYLMDEVNVKLHLFIKSISFRW